MKGDVVHGLYFMGGKPQPLGESLGLAVILLDMVRLQDGFAAEAWLLERFGFDLNGLLPGGFFPTEALCKMCLFNLIELRDLIGTGFHAIITSGIKDAA